MSDKRSETDKAARDAWIRALQATAPVAQHPTVTLPIVIDQMAEAFADSPALIGESETLSYRALASRVRDYAGWALAHRVGRGDVVCLMMHNCPEYMAVWLGITRIGGVVALINTSLAGESLRHAIDIVAPRHVIVAAAFAAAVDAVVPQLGSTPILWVHGGDHPHHARIDSVLELPAADPSIAASCPAPSLADRALCIYTSGTTGHPKAANVSHHRLMQWSRWFAGMMDARQSDRMYNCLPMYHSIGGVVATGAMLVSGGSVVVRERFSASRFWDDIAEHGCTVFQYIGELCRYLVNSPPSPNETLHRLRLACGNGLRPDLWDAFKNRFRVPHILEFYGATEGNVNIFNFEGKRGAVGRVPWFVAHRFPIAVVRYDVERRTPVRGADGFCQRCAPNEPGEVIGKIINDPGKPGNRFEGYANDGENEGKILRNAFAAGDAWFRTGDLMRRDADGYFYFIDRVGDTYRWKSENVSTAEVAEAINAFPGISDANVYGVEVAGREGRAGMAAIVYQGACDLAALNAHLRSNLPEYARPLFLRIQDQINVTATFKQRKIELVKEGFNPEIVADPMFFNDPQSKAFVSLDPALYRRIQQGEIRL